MASNITRASFLRIASVRGFASKAYPISGTPDYVVETTVLSNQLVVASVENCSPLTRVSISFKAGARNEDHDNLGVTHVLRIAAGLSTKSATQYSIIRNIQQVGATLTCSTDRETIAYTLEGTREAVDETLPFLTEVATQQNFRPWEVVDNLPRLKLELQIRPLQLRAIDLLHKAAYRSTGLGNSLFIAKHQIGKISSETLQLYVCENFTSNRAAVAGVGISHDHLVAYANNLQLPSGSDEVKESPYKGGEIRSDKGGDLAYVAIVSEGGSLTKTKEAVTFSVLQHIFGTGSAVKYGNENRGLVIRCVGSSAPTASVRTINANYSDSGLFGILICTPANVAHHAVTAAVTVLKSSEVSEADLQRGKAQLKRTILSSLESGGNAVDNIGLQALITKSVQDPADIVKDIDSVSLSDIKRATQKVACSNMSIASVGNLRNVPFLDDLTY